MLEKPGSWRIASNLFATVRYLCSTIFMRQPWLLYFHLFRCYYIAKLGRGQSRPCWHPGPSGREKKQFSVKTHFFIIWRYTVTVPTIGRMSTGKVYMFNLTRTWTTRPLWPVTSSCRLSVAWLWVSLSSRFLFCYWLINWLSCFILYIRPWGWQHCVSSSHADNNDASSHR